MQHNFFYRFLKFFKAVTYVVFEMTDSNIKGLNMNKYLAWGLFFMYSFT